MENEDYSPSHFAIDKETNKVVYAWDYRDTSPEDLIAGKKEYFLIDLKDADIDPKSVKIINKKTLEKRNIPFNESKNKIRITESELISLIENIINKKFAKYIK